MSTSGQPELARRVPLARSLQRGLGMMQQDNAVAIKLNQIQHRERHDRRRAWLISAALATLALFIGLAIASSL
jgi:hypothetical protein